MCLFPILFGPWYPTPLSSISQGWNIFQRDWMQGRQIQPAMWKREQAKCSKAWKKLGRDGQEPFAARAQHETGLREEAMLQSLPSKSHIAAGQQPAFNGASFDAASALSRNAQKKVSKARLFQTFSNYASSSEWSDFNGGIAGSEGCLRLDLIDLSTPDDTISSKWAASIQNQVSTDHWQDADQGDLHHSVCHCQYGGCKNDMSVPRVSKFVSSYHALVADGPLFKRLSFWFQFI